MPTKGAIKHKYVVTAVPSEGIQNYDPSRVYEDYDESGAVAQMVKESGVKVDEVHKHQFHTWREDHANFAKAVEEGENLKAVEELAREVRKTKGVASNADGKKLDELNAKYDELAGLLERLEAKLSTGEDASEELAESAKAVRKRGRPKKSEEKKETPE